MSTQTAEPQERPVTASIIKHGLDAAADQMLMALKRNSVLTHHL